MKVTGLDVKDDEDHNDAPTPRAFQEGLFEALGVSEGGAHGAGGSRRGSWLLGFGSGGGGLSDGGRGSGEGRRGSWLPGVAPDDDAPPWAVGPDQDIRLMSIVGPDEGDDAPLTASSNMQPMAGSSLNLEGGAGTAYLSPQFTPSFGGPFSGGSPRGWLGDDLNIAEQGMRRSGSISRRKSLSPASAGTFGRRLSTAVGMMSQRVVNLGNDPSAVEQTLRRKSSTKDHDLPPPPSPYLTVTQDPADIPLDDVTFEKPESPSQIHHLHRPEHIAHPPHRPRQEHLWRQEQMNPLKGVSLRIFGPDNWLRVRLCSVLVHPATEPIILLLIVTQTILLTIDAAPSVFDDPRDKEWGTSNIDYAILVLFIIYTLEAIARIIVSGFIINPQKANDVDTAKILRAQIIKGARELFSPRKQLDKAPKAAEPVGPSLLRSITNLQLADGVPANTQSQQCYRLARRAFLRHSFNRLDFLAVCSYWVSLGLTLTGYETQHHFYVFRMMSCLRILRLLGITSGTSVILRSLKKAAPLLVNVMVLIGFFWLIFAIIGVQSFKSSLRRNCVWVDPHGVQANFTHEFQFCGGHLSAVTGKAEPFINADGTDGAKHAKGYICPINSFCIVGDNPYGNTVSFDDILHSLELVFVIMTSNTFTSLMYYTADSDYLAACLFFAFGTVILAFWLVNLLVAVITSSFQIIREESKTSAFTVNEEESLDKQEPDLQTRMSKLRRFYDRTFWLWIILISGGFLAQTFRSADLPEHREHILEMIELGVTLILFLEILFRLLCKWRGFFRSKQNWADSIIAIVTLIMQLPVVHRSGRVYDWLTIFQIVRVYRVVWALPVIRHLLARVLGNLSGLLNLIFFVALLTYLCALFAVQLVRGDLPQEDKNGNEIRMSFFTIYNAFLGMYQIFSSENWTDILYNATKYQTPYNVGWVSAMFFIGWFILSNFIVLNMFIAVIQENFDVSEDDKRMFQVKAFLARKDLGAVTENFSLGSMFRRKNKDPTEYRSAAVEMLTKETVVDTFLDKQDRKITPPRAVPLHQAPGSTEASETSKFSLQRTWARLTRLWKSKEVNPFYSQPVLSNTHQGLAPGAMAQEVVSAQGRLKQAQRDYLKKHPNYNVSLFIFKPSNPIRRICQRLVWPARGNTRYDGLPPYRSAWLIFSSIIYAAIVAMVVLACVTTPMYQKQYFQKHGPSLRNWFTFTDAGFAALFTFEALVKIIADGLIWTPNAYLRGSWGIIDCVVLITLWISVLSSLREQGDIARAVGAFKALRALRLLNISDNARETFHSVIVIGVQKIISAAFVSLSLIIPFAVYGVNLFAGRLDSCNDSSPDITNLTDCVHEYVSSPYSWNVLAPKAVQNPYANFDTFGSSLFILFQIVSQEGWTDVSWSASSIVGRGLQPQPLAAQGNAMFFVVFNLLGAVFVLTLFVSVFMRNYTEQTGVAYLTADQRSWLELRKLLRQISPSKRPPNSPDEKWKSWCYRMSTYKRSSWQKAMTWVMGLHAVMLLLEYYPSPVSLDRARDFLFLSFTTVFVGNIVVRITGLTWTRFIRSKWDIYGLVSVGGTFITTILLLAGYENRTFIQLQKLFLVSVVFLLIPRNNQLDHLFKTASASLTAIGSLLATWFVLFLVYAIALTQTFGLTKIGPNGNGNVNFRTVPKALILLFRMSCGEGWNSVMSDFELNEPFCVKGKSFLDSDCGSEGYARALFVSWNIISMYIFVSLFVSLIYESFSYVYQRSGNLSSVSRDEIRAFKYAWAKFDPDGTGYIPKEDFAKLLGHLSGIFAMRIHEDESYRVPNILDDCRTDVTGVGIIDGVDIDALNRRLSMMPVSKIRRQRLFFNLFYEECMVTADRDNGIGFNQIMVTLAHYKIINDSKSLRLEEFLRRRWRMQKVEEQVKRNTVRGFFMTLYVVPYPPTPPFMQQLATHVML
ncbi:Ion transport protein-domain-containing protein [Terfezia claveryi]|nr:Ion transport protein-domain-containing protein [Terfezia claveryi]